jgi:ubiquinone/menaquinone biosynthesis C-methylase UbiE
MNFYERHVLPTVLDLAMRQSQLDDYRLKIAGQAYGRVLEIGVGSGLNFTRYGKQVEAVIGLDPSPRLLSMARKRAKEAGVSAWLVQGAAVTLPFADKVMDSVVMTWTLCSVPEPLAALQEIRRVLKQQGKLLFVEHGLAPHRQVERWQRRLTPLWRCISGGCHLDRKVDELIQAAGFELDELHLQYVQGPRIFTYFYEGCARPALAE